MADKNELKKQLIRKLDASIPRVVKPEQLDAAAERLIKAGSADRVLLESIANEAFGDRTALANTDIDDVNDILNQIKGG